MDDPWKKPWTNHYSRQLSSLRATVDQAAKILEDCRSIEGMRGYDQTIAVHAITELNTLVSDFNQLVDSVRGKDDEGKPVKLSRSRWALKARPKRLDGLRQRAKSARELLILGFGFLNSAQK